MIPKRPGSRVPAFSLSHSRGRVACAIGQRKPVGIDVEAVDHRVRVIDIARQFFSAEEAAALERCSADQRSIRFCELWTRHEALAKARGAARARQSAPDRHEGMDVPPGHRGGRPSADRGRTAAGRAASQRCEIVRVRLLIEIGR